MAIESFPVEATHIMMFARAVGDPNPVYALSLIHLSEPTTPY